MSTTANNENWVLGVTLGLLGSIAINTGNNVQSLGLKGLKERRYSESGTVKKKINYFSLRRRMTKTVPSDVPNQATVPEKSIDLKFEQGEPHPCSSVTWVIGTVIFVTGSLLNFASYAFAAQSMLASLESIQFVTNLIFGKFMLKANVSKTMLLGTGLTVMGTILAVQFSSRATLDLNTEDVKRLYSNPAYLVYLALMVGLLFLLHYLYHFYEKRKTLGKPLRFSGAVIPVSYSIWSALFGTQSVVQAKVLAELLSVHSSGEENIFESWFTYATIVVWILTVGVWLSRLNNALAKFDPLLIIPLLQCSFIFFAIVSGGIFFKEFNDFTVTQWIGFWGGVLVMFSGLILLTPVPKQVDEEQLSKDIATLLRSKAETAKSPDAMQQRDSQSRMNEDETKSDGSALQNLSLFMSNSRLVEIAENEESTQPGERNFRPSLPKVAVTQINAVKDVVMESANMFLTPPTGTNAITDAMVDAAKRKEEKYQRREKLKHLKEKLSEEANEAITCREILELIYDLGLEEHITKDGVPPVTKELEILRDELGSPRTFRECMLEKACAMEKKLNDSFEDYEGIV